MHRILSSEVLARAGERVRLAGWVHHQRRLSKVTFLLLRDRAGVIQVVIDDGEARARAADLTAETVVVIEGESVAAPQAPGGVEIHSPTIEALAEAAPEPPIQLHRPALLEQLPTLLDHRPLSLRHPRQRAVADIAAAAVAGFRSTLDDLGFTAIHTPKLVGGATESGANVFTLDYFGRRAFLAQSPQLYKQVMVGVLERVYEVAPVFRAEPHDTVRHLAEYTSLDVELGFVADHHDVMAVLRETLAGMMACIATRAGAALDLLGLALPAVPEPIPSVSFVEALRMVGAATGQDLSSEPDLAPAHERWLGEWAMREHRSDFVFVTGYPAAKRPFYTHPDPADPALTNSFDLIFRGIELVSGGQRLHRYDDYVWALAAHGQDPGSYGGYLEAFRYGMPPHGGFAIGLERFVARIVDVANVREVTLFPRDVNRLAP